MIDDMQGLYSHASDAYRGGKRAGRDDVFRAIQEVVIRASVAHETADEDAAFHAVQALAKELRALQVRMDAPQTV